jgi:glycine cleavage system aminomethyltransferase T/glycine/D-amino acid oxidase-like deaminating enzyme
MRDQAHVVIIGAGIVGCSVAYHLTELGWTDVLVVDQGPLFDTGGSTSHAPGLAYQTNFSRTMSLLAKYSVDLYSSLTLRGEPCGCKTGGMEIAWTPERWQDLKRKTTAGRAWGLDVELLSASEARDKAPLLSERVLGAMYAPGDSVVRQVWVAEAMARAAQERGAGFHGYTRVVDVEVADGRVRAVVTDQGTIRTETVVAAAGIWGPLIGKMTGVAIPLAPMRHQFAHTSPLPELAGETDEFGHPILRHQDKAMYLRQRADHFVIGSYRHEPLLVEPEDILEHGQAPVMPSVMEWVPEIFERAREAAADLVPSLRGLDLDRRVNGMFSFTPDGMPLLGESADVSGFWSAQAVWITHAGGVGKAVAEWMVRGEPEIDLHECDINRFHTHAHTQPYVRSRGAQQYREVYDIIHPAQQMESPRGIRVSPFHARQLELGAAFIESGGWERPNWYQANESLPQDPDWPGRQGWAARHWSPIIGVEHRAARESVVLFDATPFTKLEVSGPGALDLLQLLTANDVDRAPGSVVYTAMLTPSGGIKCDLTVVRLEPERFMVVTGGGLGRHDETWIRHHAPAYGSVAVTDVTDNLCCVSVWGPRSRVLLGLVSGDDVSNRGFPYMAAQRITLGGVQVLAVRISYVGELGWELYAATEDGLGLWDALWEAGQGLGVTAMGVGAQDSLRLEKGYRLWGSDIHGEYNPYEAGLGFAVRRNKGEFLGRRALAKARAEGLERRLSCLTLDDPANIFMGGEPVMDGDRVLGYVTSANYGYTVKRSIAYGYLPVEYAREGTELEVLYFGEPYRAAVTREPLYDPDNERLRS